VTTEGDELWKLEHHVAVLPCCMTRRDGCPSLQDRREMHPPYDEGADEQLLSNLANATAVLSVVDCRLPRDR